MLIASGPHYLKRDFSVLIVRRGGIDWLDRMKTAGEQEVE